MKYSKEELVKMDEVAVLHVLIAEFAVNNPSVKAYMTVQGASGVSRPTFDKCLQGHSHMGTLAMLRVQKLCRSTVFSEWFEVQSDNLQTAQTSSEEGISGPVSEVQA